MQFQKHMKLQSGIVVFSPLLPGRWVTFLLLKEFTLNYSALSPWLSGGLERLQQPMKKRKGEKCRFLSFCSSFCLPSKIVLIFELL